MRLYGVRLAGADFDKDPQQIEDVAVTLPYGWYVVLLLEGVDTQQQFNALHALTVQRPPGLYLEGIYRDTNGLTQLQVSGGEIAEYVQRGALWDPEVALELGRSLYQKLLTQLRQKQQ